MDFLSKKVKQEFGERDRGRQVELSAGGDEVHECAFFVSRH